RGSLGYTWKVPPVDPGGGSHVRRAHAAGHGPHHLRSRPLARPRPESVSSTRRRHEERVRFQRRHSGEVLPSRCKGEAAVPSRFAELVDRCSHHRPLVAAGFWRDPEYLAASPWPEERVEAAFRSLIIV